MPHPTNKTKKYANVYYTTNRIIHTEMHSDYDYQCQHTSCEPTACTVQCIAPNLLWTHCSVLHNRDRVCRHCLRNFCSLLLLVAFATPDFFQQLSILLARFSCFSSFCTLEHRSSFLYGLVVINSA